MTHGKRQEAHRVRLVEILPAIAYDKMVFAILSAVPLFPSDNSAFNHAYCSVAAFAVDFERLKEKLEIWQSFL